MIRFPILHAIKRYAGRVRTLRNEIRTERFMDSLPPDVQADIGWPDLYADRRQRIR